MANASQKEAPSNTKGADVKERKQTKEELFLAQTFDPQKKYVFELAEPNMPRQLPTINMRTMKPEPEKPFKPYRNLTMTSMIIWNGQRRTIRYYDGCDTIFVDEQPKDRDTIEAYIKQTQRRQFIDGKLGVYGDERMLLLYMLAASWNMESEFRTRTANIVYRPVDNAKKATVETEKLDQIEKALDLAKSAPLQKMLIHADYLGIPFKDFDSDNDLTPDEIRLAYRLEASRDAKRFMQSYGNKALEMRFFIKKAWMQGLITNLPDPNWVVWKQSGRRIADISGLKSFEAIQDKLVEYSQMEEGEEFKAQITAIFSEV